MRFSRIARRLWASIFLPCWLLFACPAHAEDTAFGEAPGTPKARANVSGLELDLSTGYSLPIGRFEPGHRINAAASGFFPLAAEIGYRINAEWFIGVHGLYAFAANNRTPKKNCPDCSHNLFRVGLFGEYRLAITPTARLSFGLGTGPQFFNTTIDQGLQKSRSVSGWELVEIRVGSQWLASEGLALGPFLGAAVGIFSSERMRCASTARTDSGACSTAERDMERRLHDGGAHVFWTVGLRAVILP